MVYFYPVLFKSSAFVSGLYRFSSANPVFYHINCNNFERKFFIQKNIRKPRELSEDVINTSFLRTKSVRNKRTLFVSRYNSSSINQRINQSNLMPLIQRIFYFSCQLRKIFCLYLNNMPVITKNIKNMPLTFNLSLPTKFFRIKIRGNRLVASYF